MKLEQIEQVIEIASTGSISKAAEKLYMKQPNLSTSIKNLETELGFEIFKRSSHGIEFTKYGRYFLSFAEPIYGQMKSLESMCRTLRDYPQLTFGVSNQYFKFVSNIFISLYKKYKGSHINMTLQEGPFTEVLENVMSQRTEIGVLAMLSNQKKGFLHLFKEKGIEYVKLCECPAHVIIGKKNPFYKKDPEFLTIDMLKKCPYISYTQNQKELFAFDSQLQGKGHYNRVTVSDSGTLHEILQQTDAFFIATYLDTAYQNTGYYPNLKAVPLRGIQVDFEIGWIRRLGAPTSDIASEFIMMLEDIL